MTQTYIVVQQQHDWRAYHPSEQVINVDEYLAIEPNAAGRTRVINLCQDFSYLSEGYYCSLLAEARGDSVIPSVQVLNDLAHSQLWQIKLAPKAFKKIVSHIGSEERLFKSYFGSVDDPVLQPLARWLFERFPCPILATKIVAQPRLEILELQILNHLSLSDEEETAFANALDEFSRKVWRSRKLKRNTIMDMAVLVNPEEAIPPSDQQALNRFEQAAKDLNVELEFIGPDDYMRLPEFDALFIRETTSIDHHTYRFAKKAESEGLVVMDDPTSIMRCTNKIYLAELFERFHVPAPKTLVLRRGQPLDIQKLGETLGFPVVIKIPDGAFSRGVVKAANEEELSEKLNEFFARSSLLLAQEFLYTDFDWRIGILNNKPLYACRYYMARNHWQIYQHKDGQKTVSGGFDTMPTYEVPKAILQAAEKATKAIGNGLYGVDVKESNGQAYVIEVNDNPSLDGGVEDKFLGKALYREIIEEFIRRVEDNRRG